MGRMTNQLQPLYQNCYTAVLALPQISIHTWGSIFLHLPQRKPECTTSLVDKAHTIPAANSPKTPPKPRVSIVAEVDDLLTQAMADESSHANPEHSPIGKVATVEAVTYTTPQVRGFTLAQLILLLKQVWRRWRLLLRVSPPMSPLLLLYAAVEVLVHQWTL